MSRTTVLTRTTPEPTNADIDRIIEQLKSTWTSRVSVRRQSADDVGFHQIYVSLDGERIGVLEAGQDVSREVTPGAHRLRVHNTLFWKTLEFTLNVGEHASFMVANRQGFGTFSFLAYLVGTNVLYLTVEREAFPGA
jgi:hypothetical protein